MSSVKVEKIILELNTNEAIDVGHAILHRLEKTVSEGYPIEKNHSGMLPLCKQLLNTAYGYDYSSEIDRRLLEATPPIKGKE